MNNTIDTINTTVIDVRHCRIGKRYIKTECAANEICKPIESSFVTECEVPNCKKFM